MSTPVTPVPPAALDTLLEAAWNLLLPQLPDELLPLACALNGGEYARLQPDHPEADHLTLRLLAAVAEGGGFG